jgi:hypothetical protein
MVKYFSWEASGRNVTQLSRLESWPLYMEGYTANIHIIWGQGLETCWKEVYSPTTASLVEPEADAVCMRMHFLFHLNEFQRGEDYVPLENCWTRMTQ